VDGEETMQPSHHAAADLAALGRDWIAAWNSDDLARVLALYAEDSEMTSDKIPAHAMASLHHMFSVQIRTP